LECDLWVDVLNDDYILFEIQKHGYYDFCAVCADFVRIRKYTIYIYLEADKSFTSYLMAKTVLINYLRINKINELYEDL
jgi:hypothetical protein